MSHIPEPPSRHVLGFPVIALAAVGIVLAVVIAFLLLSELVTSGDEETPAYVEAIAGAPSNINPLFAYLNETDRDISSLVFSGLTRIGPDGEVLPDLAESWEVDGDTVTFHLRDGVTWHSGVPFTSADVLFTYGILSDPEFQGDPNQGPLWRQTSCSAPDDLTVRCRLPQPYAPFLAYASIGIVPKHILEGVEAGELLDSPFNRAPIGTGPYRLLQIDSEQAVLRAFEKYHLGEPTIPEIELRFYPTSSTAAAAVIGGDADGLMLDARTPQAEFDAMSSEDGMRIYSSNRSVYTILYLNNREAPLNDPEVRRAIALTVDLDAIIGEILTGRAVRADTPIPPGTWPFDPDAVLPDRDSDRAEEMLESEGWEIEEGAEVRTRGDSELRISIMTDQDPIRGAVAEEIAGQLSEVGIATTVVREQSSDLVRDFLLPREYQSAVFSWDPGADPDPYPAWHSSQISATGRNIAAYSNNEADRLMEQARRTTNLDERQQLYRAFQEQFIKDTASVVLYYPVFTYFVSERVEGIEMGTLFTKSSRFNNVHEWSLASGPDIGG